MRREPKCSGCLRLGCSEAGVRPNKAESLSRILGRRDDRGQLGSGAYAEAELFSSKSFEASTAPLRLRRRLQVLGARRISSGGPGSGTVSNGRTWCLSVRGTGDSVGAPRLASRGGRQGVDFLAVHARVGSLERAHESRAAESPQAISTRSATRRDHSRWADRQEWLGCPLGVPALRPCCRCPSRIIRKEQALEPCFELLEEAGVPLLRTEFPPLHHPVSTSSLGEPANRTRGIAANETSGCISSRFASSMAARYRPFAGQNLAWGARAKLRAESEGCIGSSGRSRSSDDPRGIEDGRVGKTLLRRGPIERL